MFTIIFPSRKEEMRRIIERNKCREETRKEMTKRRNKGQRNWILLG